MASIPIAERALPGDRHEAIVAECADGPTRVPDTLAAHLDAAGAGAAIRGAPDGDAGGLAAAAVAGFRRQHPAAFSFFHDTGAGGDAAETACLHRRLLSAIRGHCGLAEPLPDTAEELRHYLPNWLARAAAAGGALIAVSGCERLDPEQFDLGGRYRPPGLRLLLASDDPAALPADWHAWEAPALPQGHGTRDIEAALTAVARAPSGGPRLLALIAAAREPADLDSLAHELECSRAQIASALTAASPHLQTLGDQVFMGGLGVADMATRLAGGNALAAAHRRWAALRPADAAWHLAAASDTAGRDALLESPAAFMALAQGRRGDLLDGWPRERIASAAVATTEAAADDPTRVERIEVAVDVLGRVGITDRLDRLLRTAAELRERCDGPDAPTTGAALDRWGAFRLNRGDHDAAGPLLERARAIRVAALGEDHPDTAATGHRLAVLYEARGDTDAAERAYRGALARAEAQSGDDPAAPLPHLANLAALRRARGALETAEPLYRRALKLAEQVLGPEHPTTAAACDNLGGCLYAGQDFEGAEQQYRRGLEVAERAFGPAHEATGAALHNLGTTLDARQRFRDAEAYYRRALELRRSALGEDHEDTLSTLHNLAAVLDSTGRAEEAEALYRQAVAGWERVVGSDHPATATSVNNLADLLRERGAAAEAESLYRRNIETWRHLLGDEHPNTLTTIGELGGLYADAGRKDEARPLLEHAVEATRRVMGPQTLPHIDAVCHLAAVLRDSGRVDGARKLLQDTLTAAEGTLGVISPRVQMVRRRLEALDGAGQP